MSGMAKGSIARAKADLVKSADGLIDAEALREATTLAQALGVYVTALQELLAQRNCPQITVDEADDLSVVSSDPVLVPLDGVIADLERLGAAFPDPPSCRVCGCTDSRACWFGCYWVEEPAPNPVGPICSVCRDLGEPDAAHSGLTGQYQGQVSDSAQEPLPGQEPAVVKVAVDEDLVRTLKGLGLTQERIAAAVGVTQGRVSQILAETQEGQL